MFVYFLYPPEFYASGIPIMTHPKVLRRAMRPQTFLDVIVMFSYTHTQCPRGPANILKPPVTRKHVHHPLSTTCNEILSYNFY